MLSSAFALLLEPWSLSPSPPFEEQLLLSGTEPSNRRGGIAPPAGTPPLCGVQFRGAPTRLYGRPLPGLDARETLDTPTVETQPLLGLQDAVGWQVISAKGLERPWEMVVLTGAPPFTLAMHADRTSSQVVPVFTFQYVTTVCPPFQDMAPTRLLPAPQSGGLRGSELSVVIMKALCMSRV